MDDSSIVQGLRVWLDELGNTEDQLAWVREAKLKELDSWPPRASWRAPLEVLLLGHATASEAEELSKRVDSEPTLGGRVDNALFTPISEPGTVGSFALRLP